MSGENDLSRRNVLGAAATTMTGAAAVTGMSGTAAAHSVGMPGRTNTNLNIREGPGLHYDVLKTAEAYTGVYLTDGPIDNDGYRWWEMQVNACDNGGRVWGWAVERYTDWREYSWPATGTIESGDVYSSSRGSSLHRAVDINAPEGNPIRAAEGGTVKWVKHLDKCGLSLKIYHGGGWYTVYCHCSDVHVTSGQSVSQKQHIADIGTSGNAYSWDPHVHFEIEYPEHNECDPGAEIGHHVWSRTGIPYINCP